MKDQDQDQWKIHAYSAVVHLASAYLAKTGAEVAARLRAALDNIREAIESLEAK
jgi:hypothetical protein